MVVSVSKILWADVSGCVKADYFYNNETWYSRYSPILR